jgi:hypothetical protein
VHVTTLDAVEYLPTAHGVQMLAPTLVPEFVDDPAAHKLQATKLELVEYWPALHATQSLAPADAPVSVVEPA